MKVMTWSVAESQMGGDLEIREVEQVG
jgi:hypothetical protein